MLYLGTLCTMVLYLRYQLFIISPEPTCFSVQPVPVILVNPIGISTAAESSSLHSVTISDHIRRCSSHGRPHVESYEKSNAIPLKILCLKRLHGIFLTKSYSKDTLAALIFVTTDHVWYTLT